MRFEDDRARAVAPNIFERQLETAIPAELEALLSEGRSGHISAEPLYLGSVAAAHDAARVHVDAAHLGHGLVVVASSGSFGPWVL